MARGLSPKFVLDLRGGSLSPILDRVHADATLCLEIREETVNIYYRGGNLLRLKPERAGYKASFDRKYDKTGLLSSAQVADHIVSKQDASSWVDRFPLMKQAMDLWLKKGHLEREMQQLVVRDNNFGPIANASDYFICDIEYAPPKRANEALACRFDFVAVEWLSKAGERKWTAGKRLVLGEIKYGEGALTGGSGLAKHVQDVEGFVSVPGRVKAFKDEMSRVFNQKRELGLIPTCKHDLESFSDEPPILLLVLANHDPDSEILDRELRAAAGTVASSFELQIAQANFFGYGLFREAFLPVAQAASLLGPRLKS